jgi:hypothetical protein
MAGYAAAARIERAMVRPIAADLLLPGRPTAGRDDPAEVLEVGAIPAPGPPLAERWSRLRDAAGQVTWYLVNPEGWR